MYICIRDFKHNKTGDKIAQDEYFQMSYYQRNYFQFIEPELKAIQTEIPFNEDDDERILPKVARPKMAEKTP